MGNCKLVDLFSDEKLGKISESTKKDKSYEHYSIKAKQNGSFSDFPELPM